MDTLNLAARSWLFVPATRPERYAKAAASGADRVIIDLEDAIEPAAKAAARAALANATLPTGTPLYVRINACGSPWFEDDLALVATLAVSGILLPKAESSSHVAAAAGRLAPGQGIVAIVETALGLWNVLEVARSDRIERLAFGALDFQVDTGISADQDSEIELAYARSRIVVASRVASLAPPIDSVTPAIDDAARLQRDSERARRFGFAGKLCIHPGQVTGVHRAFQPSAKECEWARGLLAELTARPENERGAFAYLGEMVDRPVIERARRIQTLIDQGREAQAI
ncbi:MAG: CoA ester lyase [Proteobacteria bacterium]|nr:CoA ester lyase [Pseudomonadota bacterium]